MRNVLKSIWTWIGHIGTAHMVWQWILSAGGGLSMAAWAINTYGTPLGVTLGVAVFVLLAAGYDFISRISERRRPVLSPADTLSKNHTVGVELRNQRLVDESEYDEWSALVDEWHRSTHDAISRRVNPAKAQWFSVLDTYKPSAFSDSLNATHNKKRAELTRRLERLRQLIAEIGQRL